MINWFASVLRKPPPPPDPRPCQIEVQRNGNQLTILNYEAGTASELEVLVDGQPVDAPERLSGGFQTMLAVEGGSVVVRWRDEFGEAGEASG